MFRRHQKGTIPMGRDEHANTSFLRRLLHDKTANTLMISAAALIPILATVGGSIDASRYYMAASRMQAACDAGALAARRAMVGYNLTTAERTIGENFFDQNFNEGIFGTENRTREFTANNAGVVTGTATATLPTTIMAAFGYEDFDLAVTCTADIDISNSDIMFVLDTTGSMISDGRIEALRTATVNFYDTVEAARSRSARVRYGFVPYNQQVNVGFSIPRDFMARNHTYQSRVARFEFRDEPEVFIPGNGLTLGDPILVSEFVRFIPRDPANWASGPNDFSYNNNPTDPTIADPTDAQLCSANVGTYTINGLTWTISATSYILNYPAFSREPINSRAVCEGTIRITRPAVESDIILDRTVGGTGIRFRDYRYCPVDTSVNAPPCDVNNPTDSPPGWETVDLTPLYTINPNTGTRTISLPTGDLRVGDRDFAALWETHTWGGCIEEPDTVLTDNYNPIPAGAHDLNINLIPQNESQRWKPALENVVYWRSAGAGNNYPWDDTATNWHHPSFRCPTAARRLEVMTQAEVRAYVNSLIPTGNTYHDIGMVWGTRFLSPRGLFAADNATAPNGDGIARHLVFMTDGEPATFPSDYTTHGVESMDRRITGDGSIGLNFDRHAARLQAICDAAEQEGITVWAVAFGTDLTQNLIDCASPGRAFHANDAAELNARFQQIAQQIAALRITS